MPIRWPRHWLLGSPLPSIAERHQRLPKTLALAVFYRRNVVVVDVPFQLPD